MARTQAADYDQKREVITAAATRLFAAKGFGGASLSDIAAECQSSKSLIYHYYPSKEAILYDVMAAHMQDLTGVCNAFRARQGPAEERLTAFARTLLRHYVGAADSQKILLYEVSNLPDEQRTSIIKSQRAIIQFTEDLLREAIPEAKIDRANLRARVMLFIVMLNWTHTWYNADGAIGRDQIADMASTMTLAALRDEVYPCISAP